MNNPIKKAACICFLFVALLPNFVCADTDDSWKLGLSIYGWFPDISGKTSFPDGSGGDFTIPIDNILDNLDFTFQGTVDARKGQWGLFSDVIYLDLGNKKTISDEGTVGDDWPYDVSATARFDMKSWIWTTAGYFRAVNKPDMSFDFLAGARYLDMSQSLKLSFSGNIGDQPLPGRDGKVKVGADNWDAIIGLRGRYGFGQDYRWFMPYYLDVGTGDSDFTWQAAAGLGYVFNWGELVGVWRYLSYDLKSGGTVSDMNMSGPAVGAIFRW